MTLFSLFWFIDAFGFVLSFFFFKSRAFILFFSTDSNNFLAFSSEANAFFSKFAICFSIFSDFLFSLA
jgi:hypothetical protein